ncbi:hypothetical protein AWC38_SpisGene14436 [Stylophora pistillata]|uniref:Uncharacterized protein n=1 Tax=Stylophora pistillata TaxID=50429 RepID=A0A2B4RTZ8_STYPI|nr:hypothetical protein AWC38_SpisGene14436 [Stylophora pistillata]
MHRFTVLIREELARRLGCVLEVLLWTVVRNTNTRRRRVLEDKHIDDDTSGAMHTIIKKQSERNNGRNKTSAANIDASAPEPDISVKKSVNKNKQKRNEEYRKKKELNKMVEEYRIKTEKDRESKEQKQEESNKKLFGERAIPNYDVEPDATSPKREISDKQAETRVNVASGAIPKQRTLIETSRRTKDMNGKIEWEKDSSILKEGPLVQGKERNVNHLKDDTKHIPQELNIAYAGEEERSRKVSQTTEKSRKEKTVKDRLDDPAKGNGAGNEIDDMKNKLYSEEFWPEEGEKKEEKILPCENVSHGGFFES